MIEQREKPLTDVDLVNERSPPLSIRSRHVAGTEADFRAFATALTEVFPQARYYLYRSGPLLVDGTTPGFDFKPDLFAAGGWLPDSTEMVFDPDWEPLFAKYQPNRDEPDELRWLIRNHPRPAVWFRAKPESREALQSQPEHRRHYIGFSQIDFYADPRDPEQAKLRGRFFRLLGKFATNKNQDVYRFPEDTFLRHEAKGSTYWLGHDAIAWASEDSRRYFRTGGRWGVRPARM
jgi:hypothetical protein